MLEPLNHLGAASYWQANRDPDIAGGGGPKGVWYSDGVDGVGRHQGALVHHGAGQRQVRSLRVNSTENHIVLYLVGSRGSRAKADKLEEASPGCFVVHKDEYPRGVGPL